MGRKNPSLHSGRPFKAALKRDLKMNKMLWLLAIPVIVYFFIFNYVPMFGLVMAFEDYKPIKGILGSQWVGLQNFKDFFMNPTFWQILRNTLMISLLDLVFAFPLGIVFALLLNEVHAIKFKKVVQTISYMPYFVSMVVMCGLIIEFCATNGIITDLCVKLFHIERQNLLMNPDYFWAINLISGIWQGLGYGSIVFVAAITNVSGELHEAAAIDGANRLQRVWHITIPAIIPTISMMLVLKCGLIMNVGSDKILLLYNPSIYDTADVIATHVNRMGVEMANYGYSTAVGLFNSVVGTILLLASNWVSGKMTKSQLF